MSQWQIDRRLAAHSCGGSRGIACANACAPRSLLIPCGNHHLKLSVELDVQSSVVSRPTNSVVGAKQTCAMSAVPPRANVVRSSSSRLPRRCDLPGQRYAITPLERVSVRSLLCHPWDRNERRACNRFTVPSLTGKKLRTAVRQQLR
jgi:hypothetical protein